MAITHQFDYAKPRTLDDALHLLAEHKNAVLLAGGTDLIDMIKDGACVPDLVIDLKGLPSFNKIVFDNNELSLGAGVTFSDLIESKIVQEKFPVIAEMARTVASVGIRNRATLVGNICSGVPCMDSGPVLLAYDAIVVAAGLSGERKIPAGQWFLAPRKTALQKGEVVTRVVLPLPKATCAGCWVKLGRYTGEDLAQVSVLLLALADGTFRLSLGAVAPVPVRAKQIEALLHGQNIIPSLVARAMQLIEQEIQPISDVRASKEYRMHMAKVMFERALAAACARLGGNGPAYGTSLLD